MKNKYLITLDVDGTLLDTDYRSNSPTINSVIKQLSEEGEIFIINSNRSLEDLFEVVQMFDIHGPLIGENGSFIYDQENETEQILVSDKTVESLKELKRDIDFLVKKEFKDSRIFNCDTTDINKHLDVQEIPGEDTVIFFVNQYRKYSLSIHVKKVENGQLAKHLPAVKEFYQKVKELVEKKNYPFDLEYTTSFANLLAYPKETSKAKAFQVLKEKYPNYKNIVIGDDILDKPLKSKMNHFFVVGNAGEDAKKNADYVAKEPIAKGVEEILLKIDDLAR